MLDGRHVCFGGSAASARNYIAVSVSRTTHPNDDVGMKGQIGCPQRWCGRFHAACVSQASPMNRCVGARWSLSLTLGTQAESPTKEEVAEGTATGVRLTRSHREESSHRWTRDPCSRCNRRHRPDLDSVRPRSFIRNWQNRPGAGPRCSAMVLATADLQELQSLKAIQAGNSCRVAMREGNRPRSEEDRREFVPARNEPSASCDVPEAHAGAWNGARDGGGDAAARP